MWEILAIWAIVGATIIWFIRDEQRLREQRLTARARQFALAPAYRHQGSPALASITPAVRGGLRTSERKFFTAYLSKRS